MTEYNQARAIDLSPAKWIWVPSERTLPNTFALFRKKSASTNQSFYAKEEEGVFLTYRLVGFVTFEITAPEDCMVEAMTQESRDTDKTFWLGTHFYSWSRHTLK